MKEFKSIMPEITIKYKKGDIHQVKVTCSNDIFQILRRMYDSDTVEYNESAIVIFFDSANKTLGWTKHSSGGTCSNTVDVRGIMVQALLCNATSICLSHNHPSGQMSASREDERMTQKLKDAANTLNIRVLDHIIMSGNMEEYYSFADEGRM